MSKIKRIVNAPLFNRTFAAIIDLVILLFVGAGIFIGISSIAVNVNWIKAYKTDYNQTVVDSGLMKLNKDELVPYEYENYQDYQTRFYDFYHTFYSEATNKEYDVYWFNVFIYGQDDTLNRYSEKELNDRPSLVKVVGPTYFTYAREGEEIKPNEFALPVVSENGTKDLTDAGKKQLRQYFYVSDEEAKENENLAKNHFIYYYTLSDLTSLSKLQNDYKYFAFFGTTLPLVITIFIAFVIFYFIIPLLFKNGETIGKKVMHICLVNKIGYRYNRLQLIPRFLFPMFLSVAVVFIMGFTIWPFIIVSVCLLISYLFVIFTKENKALHDYFAGTLVIDARESTWFKNIDEEERAERDVDEYVEQVKNREDTLDNENIIYTNPHFKNKK